MTEEEQQLTNKRGASEEAQNVSSKIQKLEADKTKDTVSENEESACVVCMEVDCSDRPLLDEHQCSQCKKDAWKICACCNDSLLSRICPVCRGNYAPILLHVVPGAPLSELADKTKSPEEKSMLLYKFGIVRHLIGKSNVVVWNPANKQMHFSLPREFAEDSKDISCLTVTIPMEADKIVDGTFTFDNSVWDDIEREIESGSSATGDMMLSKDAVQWLLSFTRHEGHQILSMLPSSDWVDMLDPSKSQDTADVLQSLKMSLTSPVLAAPSAPSATSSSSDY